jgi:hypothetical protein
MPTPTWRDDLQFEAWMQASRHECLLSEYLDFPLSTPEEHTMGSALPGYVLQRIPHIELLPLLTGSEQHQIVVCGLPSEVIMQFPYVPVQCSPGMSKPPNWQELSLEYNQWKRNTCSRRPRFYVSKELRTILIAVMSGADYIRHYAAMVRFWLGSVSLLGSTVVKVVTFPELENEVTKWTGFDGAICPQDIVIYGYASDVEACLLSRNKQGVNAQLVSEYDNEYYNSRRYLINSRLVVNFYACKDHGWGSLSSITMRRAAELGAREIIYVSKGATCESRNLIYEKIYCPTKYVVMRHSRVYGQCDQESIKNGIVEMFAHLNSGVHVSLPTVMEEDFCFRESIETFDAASLDNEASQIALNLSSFNVQHRCTVKFSAVQFTTDYIMRENDTTESEGVLFTLENNREPLAMSRRHSCLSVMSGIICDYFICQSISESHLNVQVCETKNCYSEWIHPLMQGSSLMSCLKDIVEVTNRFDLRGSPDGNHLTKLLKSSKGYFVVFPRPEIHPPAQVTTFQDLIELGSFSFVAFWLHPEFTSEPSWEGRFLQFVQSNSCVVDKRAPKACPSSLHKPREYLNTWRDLLDMQDALEFLNEIRELLNQFCIECFGLEIGKDCDCVQTFFQYPNAPIKSTFHIQLAFNHREGCDELNRKIHLDDVITMLESRTAVIWPPKYSLNVLSGCMEILNRVPFTMLQDTVILGTDSLTTAQENFDE